MDAFESAFQGDISTCRMKKENIYNIHININSTGIKTKQYLIIWHI